MKDLVLLYFAIILSLSQDFTIFFKNGCLQETQKTEEDIVL